MRKNSHTILRLGKEVSFFMFRFWYRRILVMLLLFGILAGGGVCVLEYQRLGEELFADSLQVVEGEIIPGGMPVGIYMETKGVMILGTQEMEGVDGSDYNPARYLVKSGDYITALNDTPIPSKQELLDQVQKLHGETVKLHLRRRKEELEIEFVPVQTGEEEYRLGLWVRDNTQGLGTVTYLSGNDTFGALGHGIHDADTGELLEVERGTLYKTGVRSIKRGVQGQPGGMEGIIIYNAYNALGEIMKNTEEGIFGKLKNAGEVFAGQASVKIGSKEEIREGEAVLRCGVDGTVKEYDICITEIDTSGRDLSKGLTLKVTDERLLSLTGGIVQGMSGSPILQDGKLVGAVTHVFVRDPSCGYGIFIENMLEKDGI